MKYCRDCGELKDASCFTKQVGVRDGLAPNCKPCANKLRRTPAHRAKMRAKYRNPRRWKQVVIGMAKARARRDGMPFDLTTADIPIPSRCPVLGIPLVIGAGAMAPNSPTLDRINPNKGYVRGNVAVISWLANKIKGDQTDPSIFERIAAYMRSATGP